MHLRLASHGLISSNGGVDAVLGRLPAAALCWPVAALAAGTGNSEAVVSASETVGASVSQRDPEMQRQLEQKTLLPAGTH